MRGAILFDLDETLVVEEPAAVAAFAATAAVAARRSGLDATALALAARARARELWYATPVHSYCLSIGISSWEGLWCRFEGSAPSIRWLRAWSPEYRRGAWALALAEQGVADDALAEELGERFAVERRARHEAFPEARAVLAELSASHRLALVTNGASCLQREKLDASGLAEYFSAVVVSGEVGVGKPDPAIFRHALDELGCEAGHAVMVGDSLTRDVRGALDAGLRAVWVNRTGRADAYAGPEIATLADLERAVA